MHYLRIKLVVASLCMFNDREQKELIKRKMFWYYPFAHASGHKPSAAIRKRDYKLILDLSDSSVQVFNTRKDISEQNNIAAKKSSLSKRMKESLISFIDAQGQKISVLDK
jgi:intergrase/recombinase